MRAGTRAGVLRGARIVAAAAVPVMVLLLDLLSFSQLLFSGPLAESRVAGLSAMLAAYVLGSLVFIALRRTARVSLSFIGAAAGRAGGPRRGARPGSPTGSRRRSPTSPPRAPRL